MAVDEPRDEELEDAELHEDSLLGSLHDWLRTQAPWWAVSCTAHMAALAMLLLLGKMIVPKIEADMQQFDPVDVAEKVDAPVDPTVVDRRPPDLDYSPPADITTESPPPGTSPDDVGPPAPATGEQNPTSTSVVSVDIGGFPNTMPGPGPKVPGSGGIPGNLLPGPNFRPRVTGVIGSVPSGDRAVVAALDWLARHQMPRRQLELARLHQNVQGPFMHRPGRPRVVLRRHRNGRSSLLGRGENASIQGSGRANDRRRHLLAY